MPCRGCSISTAQAGKEADRGEEVRCEEQHGNSRWQPTACWCYPARSAAARNSCHINNNPTDDPFLYFFLDSTVFQYIIMASLFI